MGNSTDPHTGHEHIPQADAAPPAHSMPHDMHGAHAGATPSPQHAAGAMSGAHAHTDHAGHEDLFRRRFWICLVLSVPVILYSPMIQEWFGFTMPAFPGSDWIVPVFALIVFVVGGIPFLQMAMPELKNRQPGMMTLISLAILVALIYSIAAIFVANGEGFFWELVTLIDVMLLGHWLEMRSVRQASRALDALAKLLPDTAERIGPDGATEIVPVSALRIDDVVLVRPGASIPADGRVVEGRSQVSEAMITGESKPVDKEIESKVVAGTINGDASLRVQVSALGDATMLAGIMRLVKQAEASKSSTQLLADRAAGWLFYVALGAAAITAVAWTVVIGFNVEVVSRVATVLVISCPHALGLAIPLVIAITTTLAARTGILVRDRRALAQARDIDTVVFDKTGTLSTGQQGVVDIAVAEGITVDRALALAAAVEGDSEHLIARAIRSAAQAQKLDLPAVTDFAALKGRGVRGMVNGEEVLVGGPRLLEMTRSQIPASLQAFAERTNAEGQSAIYVLQGERAMAALAVADVIRPESAQAVKRLHELGVKVIMLTGDSEAVAAFVAKELGIDQYIAQVLPENKDQHISALQSAGKRVAMVGDGVNDAPALTRADVGIAIGSGTDVAVESAGIILVKSNPLDVVKIIELSRASYRKMVENLLWATGYNAVAIPLAMGVLAPWGILLSPAIGAVFMSVSTIIVALNAQTLRRVKLTG
ncbi:MAG: copper-translocating P-type ATPase [Anaerolineae bacterium]|nr:copper-translocating P-type ATPase [Anaerolineae bacterium]